MVELMTSLRSLRLNLKESCHLEFRKVNLLFLILALVELVFDWDFD